MRAWIAAASTIVTCAACGGHGEPAAAIGAQVAPALAAALDAADREREPWRCAAVDTPAAPDETLTTGTVHWQVGGHRLHRDGAAADTLVAVIADAGGAAPATIAALGRLRARLDAASPDVVIALGGMGTTQAELEATLGTLADRARWPVVALAGDLEATPAQTAAIAALRARGATVLDGRAIRSIELGDATIATIPGVSNVRRLVAGADGCAYRPADVAAAFAALTASPGVRILASAEAPRHASAGEPTGELALVAPAAQPIDVSLHGATGGAPSAAQAGGRDGAQVALTPGTSDATTRVGDARRAPSVGVLSVHAGKWSWQTLTD